MTGIANIIHHWKRCSECGCEFRDEGPFPEKEGECPTCRPAFHRASRRIINAKERMRHANRRRPPSAQLKYDLSRVQWTRTLRHFNHQCVYCGKPWETIEHLLPMSLGGGLTADNCVPACQKCNEKMGRLTERSPSSASLHAFIVAMRRELRRLHGLGEEEAHDIG